MLYIRPIVYVIILSFVLCACGAGAGTPGEAAAGPASGPELGESTQEAEEAESGENEAEEAKRGENESDVAAEGDEMGSVSEIDFFRDDKKIYGKMYTPAGKGPFTTVILAHGYAADLSMMEGYANSLAEHGVAAVAFDFIGGGNNVKSDGTTSEMSVLTEADDMSTVLDRVLEMDSVDKDNVFLMGGSQGGFVATYVAAKRPTDVKGLIALYPAYVLQDDAKQRTDNGAKMTESYSFMGLDIGRKYDEDAMSFDIYDVMKDYDGKALIVHGTEDNVAPYRYSERAVKVLPDAKLVTIEGAGHVFFGDADKYCTQVVIDFVRSVSGMPDK
ncbi:MAG: alpha/beta hydrolase [Lachnospiraceae bacterium]|nr:alpha/beta hydrolase [Lachnospiraceae bacterium]